MAIANEPLGPPELNQWGGAFRATPARMTARLPPSPALAAQEIASSSQMPALAACLEMDQSIVPFNIPAPAQLCFTLEDAKKFANEHRHEKSARDVRKLGNLATKYFRYMFTVPDGTPIVNCLDFSYVQDDCKIASFERTGFGQHGLFHCDKPGYFSWKALVSLGLTDDQLLHFLASPITSVEFHPSSKVEAISQYSKVSNALQWTWTFGHKNGTWSTLDPGSVGKPMKPLSGNIADHSRRKKIHSNTAPPVGEMTSDAPRSSPPVMTKGTDFLFGGLEVEALRHSLEEEILWCRTPKFELRPSGYFDDNQKAGEAEQWLLRKCANRRQPTPLGGYSYTVPGGNSDTTLAQPPDTNIQPALAAQTPQPALAAQTPASSADPRSGDETAAPAESAAKGNVVAVLMADGRDLRRTRTTPEPPLQGGSQDGQRGSSRPEQPAQEQEPELGRGQILAARPSGWNESAGNSEWWSNNSWWRGNSWSSS